MATQVWLSYSPRSVFSMEWTAPIPSIRQKSSTLHIRTGRGHNQTTGETKWKSGLLTAVTPDGTSEMKVCITYDNVIMSQRFGNRNDAKDNGKQKNFTVVCKSDAKRNLTVLRKTMKNTWIRSWHLCDWVSEWLMDIPNVILPMTSRMGFPGFGFPSKTTRVTDSPWFTMALHMKL